MNRLPQFVAAGEALTDLLRSGPAAWSSQAGGSAWNVARVVAKLGIPSAFAGAVSRDVFGAELAAATSAAGLDPRFLQQVERAPLLAVVHELEPPRYFFIGDDSADLHFDAAQLPRGWQRAARWVHFGGISLAREPLAGKLLALAAELKAQGAAISYDPNFRAMMDERYDATLQRMAALADVIKVSDADLRGLFRLAPDADAQACSSALAGLRKLNPAATILYTLGQQGARLLRHGHAWHAPAPRVSVTDSIGAGDASIGALLFSLMQYPMREDGAHLRFAVAAGAAACTAAGASPPSLAQVESLLVAAHLPEAG
ncbi:carbohydrate kinase [Duganella sp. Root1480D1]|uniref:carbohydrate kinase family protein n=1 Tax=Duganella sp. Root1480D1 TaxID=1736471 RepID=UPI00070DEE01|nr:carbohydrate kinase [Duganella sp. Root1480D1]KQZ43189.1 sugar kinase [Duganella sp. Root1480D1]